ncbi:MAG: GTP 3',8-cyclase MoaA [Halothiobacillus sp. 14-56-357]|uniref:GTP 3',8-cyclase MoaA n=1 Tax=Halothiobacillus sp. 15-55-196 TaxID=1970382 RepID=UPI000BDD7055|nr:GTP 3',8-cyclase MoaA [Halothiobacillus sp. 15-55-196]OZB36423.1 MAG: GTP 3',8-cyclase MoaA [Halothiobacillus sp. 15-55-196]OZB56185.1 MAG: GTP 3',8-cyclase MoaA [Halothiobacillus sp. 14-56-357]
MSNLVDPFGRTIDYLRLSVTDRCDLRCFYCMPEGFNDFEVPEHWLTADEIERLLGVMAGMGLRRVRITGGEPLVRRGIEDIVRRIDALPGIRDIALSTNATRLGKMAAPLKAAGVDRINVSLDTLDADRFKQITQGKLSKVIDGLMAAKDVGLSPIKLNMVVMKGVNEDDVESVLEFCIEHGFVLRMIETMPIGDTGRNALDYYISLQTIKQRLSARYPLIPVINPVDGAGPARYLQIAGTDTQVGFITPMSEHFCGTCNRVRLSVDGTMYMCLGQEHNFSFRPLLRSGIPDDELKEAIIAAIGLKPERHEFQDKPEKVIRFMSMTGG